MALLHREPSLLGELLQTLISADHEFQEEIRNQSVHLKHLMNGDAKPSPGWASVRCVGVGAAPPRMQGVEGGSRVLN